MKNKEILIPCSEQSKKEGKDQESIQSSTTPDPGYQWESDNFTIRHHKREPRGQSFPKPAFWLQDPGIFILRKGPRANGFGNFIQV